MFTFITYNQALMWSRFERILAVVATIFIVVGLESLASQPTWMFASISVIIGQIIVLKCWADMVIMSQPDKNCWEFKD